MLETQMLLPDQLALSITVSTFPVHHFKERPDNVKQVADNCSFSC